jgi:beta-xylosidase
MQTFFRNCLLPAVGILSLLSATPSRGESLLYTNPVVAGDFPDPSVIRVGKDFWATATSSEWGPQFPILHSTDLVNWTVVGAVFDHRPEWAVANFWAPEIAEYKGSYYIYYVGRKKGGPLAVGVATAEQPMGPYVDHGPLVAQEMGSIDPVPFTDENGTRYLIWKEDGNSRKKPTILWAQPLNQDGTGLLGEPKELIRNDTPWEGGVVEGPFVVKRGDWFYLFYSGNGCCGTGCNYALGVARSKSLIGPWEKNPANPILAGNENWRCPGHGSIVTDEEGRYWLLYHAYAAKGFVYTGREALLDEVVFGSDGWPTINAGKGPSVATTSPLGVAQKKAELKFMDDFEGVRPRAGWNWPVADESPARLDGGDLVLTGRQALGSDLLSGLYGKSLPGSDFVATTVLGLENLKPGVLAGLAAVGDRANATGVAAGQGKLLVWRRTRGQHQALLEVPLPNARQVYLRVTGRQGKQYGFSYSLDGRDWKELLANADGQHLPPWDRAVRIALTVGGAEQAEARFDSVAIEARTTP